ncbi:MAG: CocE/NonD family hydrolase [Rhodobacteraceae bacterium]|nr:CocE/NonD family hydrolase [Paracoccaceae bacterium]
MIEVIETVWIPMPDGARLAARLWLPEDARQKPVPAVLEYIPYRRRDRTRMRDESMHPRLAEAGYASLRVDIRGNGDSDGLMLDEYSEQETQDGVDTIGWIADQPWCNGSVGMFGKSWGGYNSFQVAARRPPALKAIMPVMGTDNRWLEDVHFYGGVLNSDNFWWGSVMQLLNALPPDPEIVGEENWRDIWMNRLEATTYWTAQWLEHQTRDEMWRRGSISENYADIDVPVYFVGGWADLYRDTPFRIAEHLDVPTKVLMGPWAHLYPHEAIPAPRMDFPAEMIRFWDHWLKGQDTGLMDEPRMRFWLSDSYPPHGTRTESSGTWVEEPSWPSPNVKNRTYWLNEGKLADKPDPGRTMEVQSPQTFGSAGGDMCSLGIQGDLPVDCRIDAAGALCFRGAVLDRPLDVLGQPSVRLKLTADKEQGFVAALLIDEAPSGAQTLISRGFCNLNHRNSDVAPEAIVPHEEMSVTVPMHGIGYRVAAGHRLQVQIASTYWPVLWPSPEPVTLGLASGASFLSLPVRDAVETTPREFAQPVKPEREPPVESVRPGSLERTISVDLTSGETTCRTMVDGGVFGPSGRGKLTDTGTELGDVVDRVYSIHRDDPLSARATMEQDSLTVRGNWSVRIVTTANMSATNEAFLLDATVKCWEGEELFHSVEWRHEIPRNWM